MRTLNKAQKTMLNTWLQQNSNLSGLAVCDAVQDHIDSEFWDKLQAVNDFETLYQTVNRYINDNAMKYNPAANPHFNNHLGL